MKKIINCKLYNTDTAELVADDQYSYPSDFDYWYEALYRKKNGEFFLYGDGGPCSKYCKCVGQGGYVGTEVIIPITDSKAKCWAEHHMETEKYIEVFGEPEE